MKQYLLSVCYPAGGTQPAPPVLEKIMQNVREIHGDMQQAGVWVFGGGLHPPNTASVLRQQNGAVVITDGPFIESKEQIGGVSVIKVADLDAALGWAKRLTVAIGTPIEVRPFMEQH